MPDPRPFARQGIPELEALFAAGQLNRFQLRDLANELERRSTSRSEALWRQVCAELAGMQSMGGNDHQSTEPNGPARPRRGEQPQPARGPTSAETVESVARIFGPALERVRKRLLDLTAGNTLLNYRHPKASSLRIVDEIPAQIFDTLLSDRGMTVVGLPPANTSGQRDLLDERESASDQDSDVVADGFVGQDPRERARAERKKANHRREAFRRRTAEALRIDPSYDLKAAHHSDDAAHLDRKLQTLLFSEELETQLRKLRRLAETVIEETGANRLHLMFGFVEWHESGLSETERVMRAAPLVLLPVRLTRGSVDPESQTYRYTVERTGEDWSANVSLQEKCKADFGMVLPDVDADADETLEHYFSRIESILRAAQPTWKLRRCVTLGVVSFGKILMWRDLDPRRWPADAPLFGNKIIRDLLGAHPRVEEGDGQPRVTGVDYPIDDFEEHNPEIFPPTVIDADSSQHSALVDAKRGVNLVLQGPPGTGKSQTIANLIAGALKEGKKVLFVAEKKAALDVVHRRLQSAELGDFCLALHSHTSAKKEFIAELGERMARRGTVRAPARMDEHIRRHRETRRVLTQHADRMHEPLDSCGLTPYEVLWRALRLSLQVTDTTLALLRDVRVDRVAHTTLADVDRRRDLISDFAAAYRNVCAESGALRSHPWVGVENAGLSYPDVDDLLDLAHAMQRALSALVREVEDFSLLVAGPVPGSAQRLRLLHAAAAQIEPLGVAAPEDLPFRILASGDVPPVRAAVDAVLRSRSAWGDISGPWSIPGALRKDDAPSVAAAVSEQLDLAGNTAGIDDIRKHSATIASVTAVVRDALDVMGRVLDALQIKIDGLPTAQVLAWTAIVEESTRLLREAPLAFELRSEVTVDPSQDTALEQLAAAAARLRTERAALDERFLPSLRPSLEVLRTQARTLAIAPKFLPSVFSADYRRAVKGYRAMAGGGRATREQMTQDVRSLIRHLEAIRKLESDALASRVFSGRSVTLDSPFDAVLAIVHWRKQVREITTHIRDAGATLFEQCWGHPLERWRRAADQAHMRADQWQAALEYRVATAQTAAVAGAPQSREDTETPAAQLAALQAYTATCERFLTVASAAGLDEVSTPTDLRKLLDRVATAWAADEELGRRAETLAALGVHVLGAQTDVAPVLEALAFIGRVRGAGLPEAVISWLLGAEARGRLSQVQDRADAVLRAVSDYESAASRFAEMAQLDQSRWIAAVLPTDGAAPPDALYAAGVHVLLPRLEAALQRDKALHPMAVYRHSRRRALTDGLSEIVRLVEQEVVSADDAVLAYETVFYRSLAALVFRERSELDQFDSGRHSETQSRFMTLDAQLHEFHRRAIASALSAPPRIPGNPGPRVGDLTEEALLSHQIGLQRRHAAIRELFRRAGKSILSLKPCFLMGPQAVAQYLEPGRFHFDLVVMDEASQMRPEDALGAVLRAKQVVIVGDPMQLGPTRFFDKLDHDEEQDIPPETEDEADDETAPERPTVAVAGATVLERSESILLAAANCYPVRLLRWHYRSRHPKLIAFSNREFYNEQLIIFPTPGGTDAHDGVFLRRVGGVYGVRRNVPEAQAIVAAIRAHAAEYPTRSLMVATMNAEQADLIDSLVGQAEKEDEALATYLARHDAGPEPFAIKNLENVQGDERDVIFVSVTYGPNAEGRLLQQFGPITHAGGERRLNVLFTRAKHRLDVFCSFDPNDLRVSDSSPRGVRVLRDYLKFASGEVWWAAGTETGRDPDSDFEIAVADALRARGYETRPQVGVAGYFIDIGVVDPDHPGRFILGVEADGATYHSAKSARDRDRLRQAQLESLGWTIHRIWSTDWFRDCHGQVARLVGRIEGMRQKAQE